MTEILLIVLSCLVSIPVFVLFVQVSLALFVPKTNVREAPSQQFKVAVLIPAHNEEAVIHETIESIKSQLNEGDRIYVVADNCSDKTAEIAAGLGTEVLERVDLERRGKGYALDFGISHIRLADELPEVVFHS